MFKATSMSRKTGGIGTIIMTRMSKTVAAMNRSPLFRYLITADLASERVSATTYSLLSRCAPSLYTNASICATALYRSGGISWPTSADLNRACATRGFSTTGTPA